MPSSVPHARAGGGNAAANAAKAAKKTRGGMLESEARSILNVKAEASATEVNEAFDRLTAMNDPAKGGSKYLAQKILNARNSLVDAPSDPKPDAGADAAGKKQSDDKK